MTGVEGELILNPGIPLSGGSAWDASVVISYWFLSLETYLNVSVQLLKKNSCKVCNYAWGNMADHLLLVKSY